MATKPPASGSLRYIQRIDKNHHTWKVAIRRQNFTWHQYFTDSAYGGKRKALIAAQRWRDDLYRQFSGADYRIWRCELRPPTNTSGIVGVYRGIHRKRVGKRMVNWEFWQGYWRDIDGKRRSRTFGVGTHGEKRAKELAKRARREGVQELALQLKARGTK